MSQLTMLRRVSEPLIAQQLADLSDRELMERFAQARDADAFAVLMKRHAALVRGICMRVVRDSHQADDAFQATFLLLATKAGSLSRGELLANWLFGVARRTALKARRRQWRQLDREQHSRRPEAVNIQPWDDLLLVVYEELERLPERYRLPLL